MGSRFAVIRNVIFDWSGTLVDDLPAVLQASNHVFRLAGVPEMSRDRFRAEFCLPFKAFYDRYVPHVPTPQLEEWFHSAFRQSQHLVAELPHARKFLEFCRRHGLRTFLLSSVHPDHFAAQAAETGFGAYLDQAYVGVRDKRGRIRDLLLEQRLVAAETVFVGDMEHDIETARKGGVHACAVLTGYNSLDQLRASKPDIIVEHLGELAELLETQGFELKPQAARPLPSLAHGHSGPVVAVGGLIYNDAGEVLLVRTRKWSNLWGIPGGKVRTGERSVDALRRELLEETGLEVTGVRFVLVQDCIHSKEFYRDAHFLLMNYTCRAVGTPDVVLNDEAQEFQWVRPEAALALDLNQPTRTFLSAVVQNLPDAEPP